MMMTENKEILQGGLPPWRDSSLEDLLPGGLPPGRNASTYYIPIIPLFYEKHQTAKTRLANGGFGRKMHPT